MTNHPLFDLVKRISILLPLRHRNSARPRRRAVRMVPRPRMVSHHEKTRPSYRESGNARDRATPAEQQWPVVRYNEDLPSAEPHFEEEQLPAPADDEPARAGTLFAHTDTGYAFNGSPKDLRARCHLQAGLYSGRHQWQRRLVQTIKFEDARTIRRAMSIDISGAHLTRILSQYRLDRNEIYLPVLTGMTPGPILDIDASDGVQRRINVARRHENNEMITYQLTGLALHQEEENEFSPNVPSWTQPLAVSIYRFLSIPFLKKDSLEAYVKTIPDVPDEIYDFITGDEFLDEVVNQKNCYTLHVTYRPSRDSAEAVQDDILKISWPETFTNWTEISIKSHQDSTYASSEENSFSSILKGLKRFFSPSPMTYSIAAPILSSSGTSGATHVRVIAPEGSTIGSVAVSYADKEVPLLPRFVLPHSPYSTSHVLADNHSNPSVEVTYNYQQVEVLTHSNARTKSSAATSSTPEGNPTWAVNVSMNPGRGRFLAPAFMSLLLSLALVVLEHHLLRSSPPSIDESITLSLHRTTTSELITGIITHPKSRPTITSFPSIILSLATLYLVAPREHALVAETQALGRTITTISAAITFLYVTITPLHTSLNTCEGTLFCTTSIFLIFTLTYLTCRIVLIEASRVEALRLLSNLDNTHRFQSRRCSTQNNDQNTMPIISRKHRRRLLLIGIRHTLIGLATSGTLREQLSVTVEKWYRKATSSEPGDNPPT